MSLMPGATVTRDWEIQGNIALSLLPGASSIMEAIVQGNVEFSLLLAATVIAEVIFTVEGDIVFSLIPNSVCLPSSAEWEVTGNILLRLFLSGVEKFEKPEGIYGYGWDPSLHFFQPGEDYNAGQDFGLSKRLLGDGTGRYEYEQ